MPPGSRNKRQLLMQGTPALVTNLPAMALEEDQSPAVKSISSTAEGFMQKGSIPSADTTITKQYTISTVVYDWHFNRLWRIDNSGTTPQIEYGAPEYIATYYRQGTGEIEFRESTTNILKIVPFGGSAIAVFKSDGGYIINGANSQSGEFESGQFIQEMAITTASHAIEVDEVCYFSNSQGLFSLSPNGTITELSFGIRGTLSGSALTANYKKNIVRVGTTYAYDANTKRFYDYSGVFSYTSRQITGERDEPLAITRVIFEYSLADSSLGQIELETKTDNRDWSQTEKISMRSTDRDANQFYNHLLSHQDTGRGFQLRISSMSANMKIKRIYVSGAGLTAGSRES